MSWTIGSSRRTSICLRTLERATAIAACMLVMVGCESGQPHNPHGMQGSIGGHGHSVGQRENQGPAVGSNPSIREDYEFFSSGGVKR